MSLKFLIDENMPRSLRDLIANLGHDAFDVRDIGLAGRPDEEVYQAATNRDAIIISRDRGFIYESTWPEEFTAGVIFVNLPDDTIAAEVNRKIISLIEQRLPESLLGGVTIVDSHRALSRILRRRKRKTTTDDLDDVL